MRTVFPLVLVGLGAVSNVAMGQVPTCGVKNHMRLVNRVGGGTAQELRLDTGWMAIASGTTLDTPGSASDSSPHGTSSGSWLASSTYGRLAFSGSGSATNSPGWGLFLWVDEWIGGEPKAWFRDRLTVVSATLPPGTPVTIEAHATFTGSTSATDPGAERSASALFTWAGPTNFYFGSPGGAQTQTFTVPVGQSRDVEGRLSCTIRDQRMLGGTVYSDSIAATLGATITFKVLTHDATLSWCSGAKYAPCVGDLNGDGQVDDADFVVFVVAYNILDCADPAMPVGCPSDLNGDLLVDDADFSLFVVAYDALVCP